MVGMKRGIQEVAVRVSGLVEHCSCEPIASDKN